ncbi:alpha-1-inhibitor 3 isoform X3 [Procambarus clarkii]|uniref:alpha-1-inhibitor 3 isoform X1 n=1 Tax=Procambarus clarkii TaxID=6728 RepID=UPI0037424D25
MASYHCPRLLCVLALTAALTHGGYVVTTPKQWVAGTTAQLCVVVDDPSAPAGKLTVAVTAYDYQQLPEERNITIIPQTTLDIPAGKTGSCYDVSVPSSSVYSHSLHVAGVVGGAKLNRTVALTLKKSSDITFVQTDKYLYEPSQNVKFRILTLTGPYLSVSTDPYPEVWVQTPAGTRVAQWKNVDNTAGLVHLDFDLADEPEKGLYTLFVKTPRGQQQSVTFKVEEFVLPRYEVVLKPPAYILGTDEAFTFTVCANYTFGQPVKGNLSLTLDNNQRRKCKVDVTNNVTISGCKEVEVQASELRIIDCDVYSLKASAIVTEEGTGVEIKKDASVSITRNAVTFKTIYEDAYMKPNLPYSLKVRAEKPDGTPAGGVPMEVCAAGRCTNMTTAPDGLFTTVLPVYNTNRVYIKALNCRANMYQSEFSKTLEHSFSPSNSSLLIHAPEGKLKCVPGEAQDHLLPVLFSASDQTSAIFTVQVVSRGTVQYQSSQEYQLTSGELPISVEHLVEPLPPPFPNTIRGVVNININIPPTASPKVKVLVWYTRQDGEVVADSRELEVDKCLSNTVNLTWSASRVQPGEQASLSLSSEPDSVCSLGVVDRSTELLAVNPDPISLEAVFNFAGSFDVGRWPGSQIDDYKYCERKKRERIASAKPESSNIEFVIVDPGRYYYHSEYVDALHMFDNSGLFVFSDLTLETRPCEEERRHYFESVNFATALGGGFGGAGGGGFAGAIAPSRPLPEAPLPVFATDSASKEGSEQQPDVPRTNFPETWLWDIIVVPSSGVSTQQVTVPDTITQWVGKAVCAHPQKGVGLSQRKPITTFTPFFVDLTLPPSLKRGEILPVKMSVFNYLDQPIPVSVRVQKSEEYQILEEATEQIVLGKRSSCVPAQDKVVHIVRIKPLVIGEVNISVAAFVDHEYSQPCGSGDSSINRRDSLIKPITVEAEGFLREKTWSKYICSKDFETGEDSLEAWELETPQVMVEGSERGWVTAVGDLIALTLENLGSLIRMPYGCGEQNMINFVPNIFIMQYLKASNQTTPETTRRLLTYMKTGYQRELLYRRGDGSFSAFGNADDSGSTWLSAFVLKSFSQAQQFIVIDKNDLNQTSTWLQSNQRKDGCFNNTGKVFHKAMKGGIDGSDSPVPLTAYVMIALLEANDKSCSQADCLAAQCLQADSSSDPYVMALKAYAFALAKLPEAEVILQKLLEQAVVTKNSTHWELPKGPGKTKAVGVETAGYAIMAMMTLDPKQYEQQARKVVKWITAQRNGQGGFYSTQDTVVALQALALYETHLYQGPLNVVATVTASGLAHPFTVTDDNKLLQQLVKLPTVPTKVSITMEGQGCAVLQAVLRYNIPEAEASDAFDMTVNTNTVPDEKCVTKRITVCASYRLPDGKSNMAVIEVNLISGYIPEKDDLKELLKKDKNIKRYDVDGSKIAFYIEELTAKDTCANFRVIRDIEVEEVKPGTVRLYDYYQPEFQISKSYTLPPPTECR